MSNDLLLMHVPCSMHNDIIFSNLILYDVRKLVYVVITCKLCVYEVWKKEILHNYDLTVNCDLENNIDKNLLKESIEFVVYHAYTVSKSKIYYLIKILNKLIILEKDYGLKFFNVFDNVTKFEIKDNDNNGQSKVFITFANQLIPISTNFSDGLLKNENMDYVPVVTHFNETMESLKNRTAKAHAELTPIKLLYTKKFTEIQNNLTRLTDTNVETVPIMKFGDFWIKTHNNKLVIGIPIINNTYISRLTAYNICGYLISDCLTNICYKYNLFKLKNDSYKFDKYDELLTNDINYAQYPDYNYEWQLSNKNTLLPETSGIIVITINTNNMIELQMSDMKCFISYNIIIDNKIHKLELFIGKINFVNVKLFDINYQPRFQVFSEVYADLLAITSTSMLTKLKLQYYEVPKISLEKFLITKLHFFEIYNSMSKMENVDNSLNFPNAENDNSMSLFYNKDVIWNGTLLRIKCINKINYELKIYSKNEFGVINVLKAISEEYNEKCKILSSLFTCDQSDELKKLQLHQSISNEINLVSQYNKNVNSLENVINFLNLKCKNEFLTDLSSINL